MDEQRLRLGSIGAGNMARALLGGVTAAGLAAPEDCRACDVKEAARQSFQAATRICAVADAAEVMRACDVIVLAVKPQQLPEALDALRPLAQSRHLFVSIAAGARTAAIEQCLGLRARVVRVMPNTPALIGAGAAAVAPGAWASPDDVALTLRLMRAVGLAVEVAETDMDAVTALSGSGPAYFFLFVEHLTAAGIAQGLAPQTAATLAKQTALGAARMMLERPETPEQLRIAVTSPGGTTEAALKSLEAGGFGDLIRRAIQAATERGRELGRTS